MRIWAKAKERVKSLEAQHGRTLRCMGIGMLYETAIGSPQGGVISPLLANIYLNYLDTIWEKKFTELGTLVRYADDLVILCKTKKQALESISVLKAVFSKLELQMNTSKSKLVNLWGDQEGFDFLGMHHRKIPKQIKGMERHILRSYPSKKAMKKMKQKVKESQSREIDCSGR
ncbi:reverse transcriptase domain-containing protein [Aneurinibacillus sp. Ricciae_BoGa-3]|uniref:reverse transcriptase domain-containing protein n=1 Tax=Aneurinibacillus sp. Ricciae_BoGa-3 TaxID=3022697 RepID=UPI0023425E81|nr:reverse transcriptase domain-containing protein [Aneurinibacillus sp. Ricciae_BoGa-3]WCK52917.1 reverse transcriptase domain-containing protein [Aneurinibacillus sp. Ricciae_BoGa-3]